MKYEAILFDLDGTLIDSAPDLVATLNALLEEYRRPTHSLEAIRNCVSYGSTKLLEVGFAEDYPLPFPQLRQKYLDMYQTRNTYHTNFFDGVSELLENIENSQTPWGIITNKPTEPTIAISEHLGINKRASAIVCGDTLPVAKPDPSPIILACEMIGVNPESCVYIGDCDRDITAGKLAGMQTIACQYGYVSEDDDINQWGADKIVEKPMDIWTHIN